MCFCEYKQTSVFQYGSVFQNRQRQHDQMSSKILFLFQSNSVIDMYLNMYHLSTSTSVWSYIVSSVYANVSHVILYLILSKKMHL